MRVGRIHWNGIHYRLGGKEEIFVSSRAREIEGNPLFMKGQTFSSSRFFFQTIFHRVGKGSFLSISRYISLKLSPRRFQNLRPELFLSYFICVKLEQMHLKR